MSKLYDLLYTMIGKLNSSVKTTAQVLTDAEKTQARANIGAQVAGDYAKKSEIPTVPTKVSAFTNDAGYLTEHQDLSEYAKKTEIPSKLPNPHALTINGKTYDGSSAVSVTVEGGADWNAANGQPGHVLNRTHYVEIDTVLLNDTVTFTAGSCYLNGPYLDADEVQLVAGASYAINYNGAVDECVAVDDGDGSVWLRPNLPAEIQYVRANLDEGVSAEMIIWPSEGLDATEADVKIVLTSEIIHKLDKKFLPDDIGGGMGSADWNAAEGEPGHVKHRTHWIDVDIVEILPETQAKIQSSQYDEALSFVPLLEVKQGDIITVAINGMEYKCAAQAFQNNMYVFGDGNYFGFGNSGAGEPFCVLYMAGSNSGVYVKQDCTISIYKDNSIIHKLDPKFLPEINPFGDRVVFVHLDLVNMKLSHTLAELDALVSEGKSFFVPEQPQATVTPGMEMIYVDAVTLSPPYIGGMRLIFDADGNFADQEMYAVEATEM